MCITKYCNNIFGRTIGQLIYTALLKKIEGTSIKSFHEMKEDVGMASYNNKASSLLVQ